MEKKPYVELDPSVAARVVIGALDLTASEGQVKHEFLFCARVVLRNIREFLFKKSRILECLLYSYIGLSLLQLLLLLGFVMAAVWLLQLFNLSRKHGKAVLTFASTHPKIFGSVVGTVGISAIYSIQKPMGSRLTRGQIDDNFMSGSRPNPHSSQGRFVYNSSSVHSIKKLLTELEPENGKFGIIMGPTGTGKTQATIVACNDKPEWILYHEITHPFTAAKQLAMTAGIPIKPSIAQRIEEYFLPKFRTFYFPQDPVKAMTYVLDYVAWRAEELAKDRGLQKLPCFVIDGVEALAKYQPDVFNALVRLAKYYARTKKLRIVLVYSDGDVLSSIEETLKHRLIEIVEVDDLNDEEAERYLVKNASLMPNQLVKRIVSLIGGRLLHLNYALDIYHENDNCSEDEIYEMIRNRLYSSVAVSADNAVVDNAPTSEYTIQCIATNGPLFPSELKKNIGDKKDINPAKVQETINNLISCNLLRYRSDGRLIWHNKFIFNTIVSQYQY